MVSTKSFGSVAQEPKCMRSRCLQTFYSCRLRQLRKPLLLWRRALTHSKRRRSGPKLPLNSHAPWLSSVNLWLSWKVSRRKAPGTSTLSSETHSALRLLSRPSKTTTLSYSLLTNALPSHQSRRLARTCTASRSEKWTLLSDQTDKRRLMLFLTSNTTLLRSQTRSESCEQAPPNRSVGGKLLVSSLKEAIQLVDSLLTCFSLRRHNRSQLYVSFNLFPLIYIVYTLRSMSQISFTSASKHSQLSTLYLSTPLPITPLSIYLSTLY